MKLVLSTLIAVSLSWSANAQIILPNGGASGQVRPSQVGPHLGPFDLTPNPEEIRAKQAFQAIGQREGLTAASLPKLRAAAEQWYEASKTAHGEGHPLVLSILHSLVRLYHIGMDVGPEHELQWALKSYEVIKNVRSKTVGSLDDLSAPILGDAIMPLCNARQLDDAATLVQEALPLYAEERFNTFIQALGPVTSIESPQFSFHNGLLGIGEYYRITGDLAAAEPWFRRAMAFAKDILHSNDDYLVSERCLASVYEGIRDYSRAEPLRVEALQLSIKGFGSEEHPGTTMEWLSLGWNYNKQGRFVEADKLLRRALANYQKSSIPNSRMEKLIVSGLADVLYHQGRYEEAATLNHAAVVELEKHCQPDDLANALLNEGLNFLIQAKLDDAARDFRKAITLYQQSGNPANDDFHDRALSNLATTHWLQGDKEQARELTRTWVKRFDKRLARVLAFTDEDQRLSWMHWQWPYDLPANFDMPQETAQILVRTKGIVEDSVIEDRSLALLASSPAQNDWEELVKVRNRIRQAWTQGQKADASAIVKLEARESELQSSLARAGTRAGQTRAAAKINWSDVQKALPDDAALLDFFSYAHSKDPVHQAVLTYGVVVTRPGRESKLFTINRPATELDEMTMLFVTTMNKPPATPRDKDVALTQLLKYFHKTLIKPLEDELHEVKSLIISGDGSLNFLPFACLLDADDKFLCERFTLRMINNARDLATTKASPPADKTLSVFGGANYKLTHRDTATKPGSNSVNNYVEAMVQSGQTMIHPLPGTQREMEQLTTRAQSAGWKISTHAGDDATEATLRTLPSPAVLHIATHGYFLPRHISTQIESAASMGLVEGKPERLRSLFDPMQRSGLLLAGAEDSFEQWRSHKAYAADNDGLLTAGEAAMLDLRNTWLVTLSACDTGIGDLVTGEGVIGLRRAFHAAGARNVLMTLWPIYDVETVDFLNDFYSSALPSGDAALALNNTERLWLQRETAKRGLWEAIKRSAAFILVGMGR